MLSIAYALFLANVLFGLSVRTGIVPRGRYRWIHHTIYALAVTAILAALAIAVIDGGNWPRLAAMTAILAATPRFPGRTPSHMYYAIFALAVYTLVVFAG